MRRGASATGTRFGGRVAMRSGRLDRRAIRLHLPTGRSIASAVVASRVIGLWPCSLMKQLPVNYWLVSPPSTPWSKEPVSVPPEHFTEHMRKNYPPGTVISDVDWHAPRIWRAAMYALNQKTAAPPSPTQDP